jgi:hypothetical protein
VDLLWAAIFAWWILGGISAFVWPQLWEWMTRKTARFYGGQDNAWDRFWLSPTGRIVNQMILAATIAAGIIGFVILYLT